MSYTNIITEIQKNSAIAPAPARDFFPTSDLSEKLLLKSDRLILVNSQLQNRLLDGILMYVQMGSAPLLEQAMLLTVKKFMQTVVRPAMVILEKLLIVGQFLHNIAHIFPHKGWDFEEFVLLNLVVV